MTSPSSAFAMKPLDDLEQRVTLYAAVVGGAAFLGLWAPGFFETTALLGASIGVVLAGLLGYSSRRRSRFFAGVMSFLVAFPWPVTLAGTPFLILGMWLWFRGKPSPEEIEARRQARDEALAAKRAARGKGGRRSGRGGDGDAPAASTGKAPPKPSKRYTPPARKR
ncbi:MAG: hypothetical protein QOK43_2270 [Acidimicrobiaceae bacterium]|jgi:hypothetical protein|nr:hypothetical protein [Acidimicrobiaceae bacterium]MDQ1446646.1 hypothetical protein [Acidimicrobiaceae bacterium]